MLLCYNGLASFICAVLIAPEFGTDVVARKSKSPIAKQVVRKKRKGKKNNNKKQMNLQDEEYESHESAHEGLPNQAPIDSILRFDISKGFVSSQSSSESEFDNQNNYLQSRQEVSGAL